MSEKLTPFTKERFDEIKARFESMGYTVISKWRPGLKHIRLSDIVLGTREEGTRNERTLSMR